jgi:hypothetical protein
VGAVVSRCAFGEEGLDERVIYEKVYKVGTCLYGLVWLDKFGRVHVLEVCKAEAKHRAQGVIVRRKGFLQLVPRVRKESRQFDCLYGRHGGGLGSRSCMAVRGVD